MKNNILITLLFVTILTLVACAGGASPIRTEKESTQAQQEAPTAKEEVNRESIEVVMNDIYDGDSNDNTTNPPVWSVTSGAEVRTSLDNKGGLEHNWAVVKLSEQITDIYDETTDQAKLLFDAGNLAGGVKEKFDFTAPLPGEYQVISTVPGHLQIMQGKLAVEQANL